MFKFLERRAIRKGQAESRRGYDYAAGCILRGEKQTFNDESWFDSGVESALLDFEEIRLKIRRLPADRSYAKNWKGCQKCFGSGGKLNAPCKACDGTGKIFKNEVTYD